MTFFPLELLPSDEKRASQGMSFSLFNCIQRWYFLRHNADLQMSYDIDFASYMVWFANGICLWHKVYVNFFFIFKHCCLNWQVSLQCGRQVDQLEDTLAAIEALLSTRPSQHTWWRNIGFTAQQARGGPTMAQQCSKKVDSIENRTHDHTRACSALKPLRYATIYDRNNT
jgi:hypothetical protein